MAAHFIARGTHQVQEIPAKAQHVGGIKGGFQIERRRFVGVSSEKVIEKHGTRCAVPARARCQVFQQQIAVTEGLLAAPPDHVGCLNDLVPDRQQDVTGAVVVISRCRPVYGAEHLTVVPDLGPAYGYAGLSQHAGKGLEILLGLFQQVCRERPLGDVAEGAIRILRQLGAGIGIGEARAPRGAHNHLLQGVPLVTTPYQRHARTLPLYY